MVYRYTKKLCSFSPADPLWQDAWAAGWPWISSSCIAWPRCWAQWGLPRRRPGRGRCSRKWRWCGQSWNAYRKGVLKSEKSHEWLSVQGLMMLKIWVYVLSSEKKKSLIIVATMNGNAITRRINGPSQFILSLQGIFVPCVLLRIRPRKIMKASFSHLSRFFLAQSLSPLFFFLPCN